eukprot:1262051-Rhodomonas_salina.1
MAVPLVAPLPLWQLQLNKVDEVLEKYKNLNVVCPLSRELFFVRQKAIFSHVGCLIKDLPQGSPRKQSEQQEGRKYQPEEPIRDRSLQVKAVTAPWELGDRGGRRYEVASAVDKMLLASRMQLTVVGDVAAEQSEWHGRSEGRRGCDAECTPRTTLHTPDSVAAKRAWRPKSTISDRRWPWNCRRAQRRGTCER